MAILQESRPVLSGHFLGRRTLRPPGQVGLAVRVHTSVCPSIVPVADGRGWGRTAADRSDSHVVPRELRRQADTVLKEFVFQGPSLGWLMQARPPGARCPLSLTAASLALPPAVPQVLSLEA